MSVYSNTVRGGSARIAKVVVAVSQPRTESVRTRPRRHRINIMRHNVVQLANACREGGGVLTAHNLITRRQFLIEANAIATYAPGCGLPTRVAGTNGGVMPCGAQLTRFGKTEQYFCADCDLKLGVTT